jgi:biopolymer transport protein ExbB
MSDSNHLVRWTVAGRWIATVGIGLVVALGYGLFRPARGQDRGAKPAAAAAEKAAGALMSRQQAAANAAADTAGSESDTTRGEPAKEADTSSVLHDIKWRSPHMWAFYAIWFVSIIAGAYAVERFLGLRRSKVLPPDLVAGLRALVGRKGEFDLRHALRLCKQYPSATATVVRAMLAKVGRSLPEVERAMTEACEHEATQLYANVRMQNLTFNVAPMLGLAGTVHGIILCFYTTAHLPVGENKMGPLATGIYAALICTLAGLIVAIPSGVLAHYFESRIMKMFQQIEELTRSLVPRLERFEGRPRQTVLGEKPPQAAPPAVPAPPVRTPLPPPPEKPLHAKIIELPRDGDGDLDDEDDPLPAPKPRASPGR